jgi:probable rRNA maturation factor
VPPAARPVAAEGGRTSRIYQDGHRVDVTVRPGVDVPIALASLARDAARALTMAGAPPRGSLGVILSHDAELEELNVRHMGHTGPTDVLSFPLLPPSAFPMHAGRPSGQDLVVAPTVAFALPPRRRLHLGDVVASVQRAAAQAHEGSGGQTGDVRWSVRDELRLLVVHGTLHVCGWDHAAPDEERAMRDLERTILASA